MNQLIVMAAGVTMLAIVSCTSIPVVKSSSLAAQSQIKVETIEDRTVAGQFDQATMSELKTLNKAAHKPTFGLVRGFYQLPVSMPGGAVAISEGQVFGQSYRSFFLENSGSRPYAIEPVSPEQAQVLSTSMNHMLDAGVRFVDVSMADAMKVMRAEQRMIEGKDGILPGRSLPSGVDLLLSIQRGLGASGPVFIGRVIRTRDGRLFALSTCPDAGPYSLEPLIQRVVADSLKRLAGDE